MSAKPILILQMQRMGDLVLSFPLLAWLQSRHPGTPLWVVGEEHFFVPLTPLSPQATYFSYGHSATLEQTRYSLVINLSHRREAAELAGRLQCDELIGPYIRNGVHHIRGQWQLYRASITQNNRYNRYHWSDLNALDCVPLTTLRTTDWGWPRPLPSLRECKVGLFLGASEENKRPDVGFWRGLARYLLQRGLSPVLLGGKAEVALGREVARQVGLQGSNMCGRFDVRQLYQFIQQLDVLITPDTGPMHIATWAGTLVINLSMGNVSPWETGPMSPNHFVIRGNVPCLDCWECVQPAVLCKQALKPASVGKCVEALLAAPQRPVLPLSVKNLHLLRSVRQGGLHGLECVPCEGAESFLGKKSVRGHEATAHFWQSWFGAAFGINEAEHCRATWQSLRTEHEAEAEDLRQEGRRLLAVLNKAIKTGDNPFMEDVAFWKKFRAAFLPLTGFLQLLLHNAPSVREGRANALEQSERLLSIMTE